MSTLWRWPVVAAVTLMFLTGGVEPSPAQAGQSGEDPSWREVLWRSLRAARDLAYEGRLVVVSFDEEGPTIGELEVRQSADGTMVSGPTNAWMLGRIDGEAFFGDENRDLLLRLGGVERAAPSPRRIDANYDVRLRDGHTVLSREARALEFYDAGDRLRERLLVDEASGLVVRRETYGDDGRPVRLVTFTRLSLSPVELPDVEERWSRDVRAAQTPVTLRGVGVLREAGWHIPDELHAGFEMVDVAAFGEGEVPNPVADGDRDSDGDGDALHLLYSDGLYTLSVYEQHGRLDERGLVRKGAAAVTLGGRHAYRWPGSQPATYVWSGDGLTFTAVSDAPPDAIGNAVRALPHDPPRSFARRLTRGLARVASWLWPFG